MGNVGLKDYFFADLGEVIMHIAEVGNVIDEKISFFIGKENFLEVKVFVDAPIQVFIKIAKAFDEFVLTMVFSAKHVEVQRNLPIPWIANEGKLEKIVENFRGELVLRLADRQVMRPDAILWIVDESIQVEPGNSLSKIGFARIVEDGKERLADTRTRRLVKMEEDETM